MLLCLAIRVKAFFVPCFTICVRKRSENMKTFTEKYWIRLRAIGLIVALSYVTLLQIDICRLDP